jgi:hypothetical protein
VSDNHRSIRVVGELRADSLRHLANCGKGEFICNDGSPT